MHEQIHAKRIKEARMEQQNIDCTNFSVIPSPPWVTFFSLVLKECLLFRDYFRLLFIETEKRFCIDVKHKRLENKSFIVLCPYFWKIYKIETNSARYRKDIKKCPKMQHYIAVIKQKRQIYIRKALSINECREKFTSEILFHKFS